MPAISLIIAALQATPQLVQIIESGFNLLRGNYSATDQASVDKAVVAAKAQLDADVDRIEAEK